MDYYSSIRPATNQDCEAVITLIDQVLGEWNDSVCLDGSELDLLDLESNYWDQGGAFVVMEVDDKIVGSHGILPLDIGKGICTFKRLYLAADLRGTNAGRDLMQWNIDWTSENAFRRIEFWSDTRFERAHRFFAKLGFQKLAPPREMNDSHETYWEYQFFKELK